MLTPTDIAAAERVSTVAVREWIVSGVRLPDGSRVRLAATRLGGRWRIAAADLARFEADCTRAAMPAADPKDDEPTPCPVPPKSDWRRLDATLARLKARGIG